MKHQLANLQKQGQTTEKQLQQEKGLASEKVKQKDMWNRLASGAGKALEKVTEELQQIRERQAAVESKQKAAGEEIQRLTEVLPYPGQKEAQEKHIELGAESRMCEDSWNRQRKQFRQQKWKLPEPRDA